MFCGSCLCLIRFFARGGSGYSLRQSGSKSAVKPGFCAGNAKHVRSVNRIFCSRERHASQSLPVVGQHVRIITDFSTFHTPNIAKDSPIGTRLVLSAGFQSPLSVRGATCLLVITLFIIQISIHALLAESDRTHAQIGRGQRYFNPRSPIRRWGATFQPMA